MTRLRADSDCLQTQELEFNPRAERPAFYRFLLCPLNYMHLLNILKMFSLTVFNGDLQNASKALKQPGTHQRGGVGGRE